MMLLLLIGGLIGLVATLREKEGWLTGFCLIMAGLAVGAVFSVGLGIAQPRHYVLASTVKLVSMRDSNASVGSFFIGSGNFGPKTYYSYYRERGDGGYQNEQMEASARVTIYEEERQDGVLKIYQLRRVDQSTMWFAIVLASDAEYARYEFHIPEGSIKKVFALGE